MRTFLVILTTALLTALGLIYARTSNAFPEFFSLLPLPSYVAEQPNWLAPTGEDCTTPWWDTVVHGDTFLSFANETWSIADGKCASRTTVCNNGSWSAEQEPLAFKTCLLDMPKPCDVDWFLFAHGTSHEFFKVETWATSCPSQERNCVDGVVDWDETYTLLNCPWSCPTPEVATSWGLPADCPACPCLEPKPEIKKPEIKKPTTKTTTQPVLSATTKPVIKQVTNTLSTPSEPNCPSPFWGARREPGQQGSAYKKAVAAFGTSCEKVNIVCSRWSIRYGSKSNPGDVALWAASSCRVAEPVNCESACGPVTHGQQVTTYKQAIIPHGNGQVCNDIKVVSTCTNGSLSPAGWSSCSCQVAPPAACTAPNGQTVAHGSSLTLYQYAQIQAVAGDGSDTCVRQWRKCHNGSFVDQNGNPAALTYKYPTCTVIAPTEGWGAGGDGVPVWN